ncbi:MAG: glycosyltransferase family 2 protein [Clostridiales bacterium]|nr:glycosyltransferase [Eubacteriales bacterium]MDH7566274.1 glycosyltransferase family 2 protein [Clostridiales bacterium]
MSSLDWWYIMLKSVLNAIVMTAQYALLPVALYHLIISSFAWIKRKDISSDKFAPVKKFAFIVAAHNEETVIGNIVRNLKDINYPKDLYDIYVIADNCTDNTAKIAEKNGARVCERFNESKKGKGYALEWMFDKLFKMDKQYDAVCVLDADNLVSQNYLREMNAHLCRGHKIIQGYLDSKNPHDSLISGSYSITYWLNNRLFQLPRYYIGLCCAIGGTGFVVATDVLKEIGWGATCLTEDLEFTVKLVLRGLKVHWAHEAIVYDEKPITMAQSWKQRKRWMQGQADCIFRYLKDLLIMAFKNKSLVAFDCALYLVQPVIIVINGVALVLNMARLTLSIDFERLFSLQTFLSAIAVFVMTYISIIFIFAEGKYTKKVLEYFLIFPFYNLTWVPIIIQGFIDRNKKEWVHTLHTRAIEITDIENIEKAG